MPQVEYVDEHIESLGHGGEAVGFVPASGDPGGGSPWLIKAWVPPSDHHIPQWPNEKSSGVNMNLG